jgi:hypothetical protein
MGENPRPKDHSDKLALLAAFAALTALAVYIFIALRDRTETAPETGTAGGATATVGGDISGVYVMRRGGRVYGVRVRRPPKQIPFPQMPDVGDIADALAARGHAAPKAVWLLEDETERTYVRFGRKVRWVTQRRFWADAPDGRVLAFDTAFTEGGVPQRLAGRLTVKGAQTRSLDGDFQRDVRDTKLPAMALIPTGDLDFLTSGRETGALDKPFLLFLPEQAAPAALNARMLPDAPLALRGGVFQTRRFEVRLSSVGDPDDVQSGGTQQLWFNIAGKPGESLLRAVAVLEDGKDDVVEWCGDDAEAWRQARDLLTPLKIEPPPLPPAPLPYPPRVEQRWRIRFGFADGRADDHDSGRITVRFDPQPADAEGPAGWRIEANVVFDTEAGNRRERAVTRCDENLWPLSYAAVGREAADATADYEARAERRDENVRVSLRRRLSKNPDAAEIFSEEKKASPSPKPTEDPLTRVAYENEEQAVARGLKLQNFDSERILTPGVYFFDFNRVEHLASFAHRLPRPAPAADKTDVPVKLQDVALFFVRRNQDALMRFSIRPEPRPQKATDDELDKQATTPDEDDQAPQLFIAETRHPLLPCRLLLAPDGRLLEFTRFWGERVVIYTLDDPLMRRRAARRRKEQIPDAPRLIRPPWWSDPLR